MRMEGWGYKEGYKEFVRKSSREESVQTAALTAVKATITVYRRITLDSTPALDECSTHRGKDDFNKHR